MPTAHGEVGIPDNSAQSWIHRYLKSSTDERPPLLDIRPTSDYVHLHVESATHFTGLSGPDGLISRASELPPPQSRRDVAVLASSLQEAHAAAQHLHDKGFPNVTPLTLHVVEGALPLIPGAASRPLWEPAPVLLDALPQILPHIPEHTALDIGAGAGRDTVYLAMKSFSVTCVDRDKNLVARALSLAKRHTSAECVKGIARTFGANLADDAKFLRENAAALLLVVRFLRRGVLDLLWQAVQPGGFVIYEHFLLGCERFGSPVKPSQMLAPGELQEVFSAHRGFTVWQDLHANLPDGRPVVRFIARRANR